MTRRLIIALALVVVTLGMFGKSVQHGFVNYDDDVYVTENPQVRRGLTLEGLGWAFGATVSRHWHPLTLISHMLDVELYGLDPGGHHLTSLLLHTANTVLLFLVLSAMTGSTWAPAFVSALFALHPLHVEPVAWVSDRKDLLAGFFWILALGLYHLWTLRRGLFRYGALAAAFACGVMSKATVLTLPLVLLVMDFWPLGRLPGSAAPGGRTGAPFLRGAGPRILLERIAEKAPLLLLSGASALVTVIVMARDWPAGRVPHLSSWERILGALSHYGATLEKFFWPGALTVRYPRLVPADLSLLLAGTGALLGLTWLALRLRGRHPYFLAGWLWFLITLLPTLGLVQAGPHRLADRYTYLPFVGLFIVVAWGVPGLMARLRHQRLLLLASAFSVLVLAGWRSWVELGYWKDGVTLLEHALRVNPESARLQNNLGTAYVSSGDLETALLHYEKALRLEPRNPAYLYNLAYVLLKRGEWSGAERILDRALAVRPRFAEALNARGLCRVGQGRLKEGIEDFRQALSSAPHYTEALQNLGQACLRQGRLPEALTAFQRARSLAPDHPGVLQGLGLVLARLGRPKEALACLEKAHALSPKDPATCNDLASLYARTGRLERAVALRKQALTLAPEDGATHYQLAVEQYFRGAYEEAVRHCDRAIALGFSGVEQAFLERLAPYRKRTSGRPEQGAR